MVFKTVLQFTGKIERAPFEQALHEAWVRQILLRCRIEGRPFRDAAWHFCADWKPQVEWLEVDSPSDYRAASRLVKEPFFRIWALLGSGNSTTLVFQFHHATVDGLAAARMIGQVLSNYAQLVNPAQFSRQHRVDKQPTNLAYDRLPNRNAPFQPDASNGASALSWQSAVKESWKLLSCTPVPVAEPNSKNNDGAPLAHGEYLTASFSNEEYSRYRSVASRHHANLNDLLLCDFFCAIAIWNSEVASKKGDQHSLRITMPVSRRTHVPHDLPVCNGIGFAFLTRKISETHNFETLLDSIREENRLIRKYHLADHFSVGLQAASHIPGAMGFLTSPRRCFSTAVLSNLGDFTRRLKVSLPQKGGKLQVGGLTLESVAAAPPIQANTRVTACVMRYAGKFSFTFRFDETIFSRQAASEFIEILTHLIRSK